MSLSSLKALFSPELAELSAYRVPPEPPAVKLDANESPWDLPGEAWESVLAAVRRTELHRYPDGRAVSLRRALASSRGGDQEQYVLGAGSDELIALLATAVSRPRPGESRPAVLYPEPTFVMYGMTSQAHGWRRIGVPLDDDWDLDVDATATALERDRPNLAYYASPNNPTGNSFSKEKLQALVAGFPDTLHVIDEAYGPFSGQSYEDLFTEYPHCALLGTLSKIGFAAIRVGWVRLDPALAEELEKVRQPFNLNAVSQEIARLAFTELAPVLQSHIHAVVAERARLATALEAHAKLTCFASDANFLLVRYEGDVSGLCQALLGREIAARRFSHGDPRLRECVRITVGTPQENQRLIEALEEIL